MAQRDERCGDLDGDLVTLTRVRLVVRALDRDDQVSGFAIELIGIGVAARRFAGGIKFLTVDFGTGEPVDLHEVAQRVGKRNVTGLMRAKSVLDVGGIARPRGDRA